MKSLFLLSLLISSPIFSAEVDMFTYRNEKFTDVADKVNGLTNKYVANALKRLNEQNVGCNEEELYKELRTVFANHSKGELTISVIHSPDIEKKVVKRDDSIFKDWSIFDGFVMGAPFWVKNGKTISPLVKMGDHVVGTDKFEHMFGRGFKYFEGHYLKNNDLIKTIKKGILEEKVVFGGIKLVTGVFSYADLSANFNGMRFWNHMLQLREDVLGQNLGPYITCQNNTYVQAKKIDFTNYFDESMDEGINCSKFPSKKTLKKYKSEVEKLGMTCPMDLDLNRKMAQKYGSFSHWIINPNGNGVVDYTGEFEE